MKRKQYRIKDSCGKFFTVVASHQAEALKKVRQLTNAKTIYFL